MAKSKRLMFTFDERSYDTLEHIKETGKFGSLANTVRESLRLNRALQNQVTQGFSEVIVRNPKTGVERVLVIPGLTDGTSHN